MKSTIIKAPAKVNLYLDVINKRADGYHNIETVFERIDLCDWIKISIIPKGIELVCQQGVLPNSINNTAYKAAELLTKRYNLKCGFRIQLDKRIPIASGLGGGSSDAAAVLLSANDLLNLKIKRQTLLKLAKSIGADVPFFVSEYKRAIATGIGERLSPLKQRQRMYFLLVVADIKIRTSTIYNRLDSRFSLHNLKDCAGLILKNPSDFAGCGNDSTSPITNLGLTRKRPNVNILRYYFQELTISSIKNVLFNRLEEVILPSYPVLGNIKKALKKTGAEGIVVSGSGSAVYGIFQSRKEAVRAESKLMKKGNWQLFIARNC